jgi:hypothetical protein
MGGGIGATPEPFTYTTTTHVRRHGPYGYSDYKSYRDWLRDEFSFRCVFCCRREQWGLVAGNWDIDHFVPQSSYPQDRLNYENLLYVCHTCNSIKNARTVLDPCRIVFGHCVKVHEDGTIIALNENGKVLIEQLRLDNEDYTKFRSLIIAILRSLLQSSDPHDRQTYIRLMGYPDDLPDLSSLRPPGNRRPEGINDSWYARRIRGELSEIY